MKHKVPALVITFLAAGVAYSAVLLESPILITPELESYVLTAADGRRFVQIDDMLIPADSGEKSALWGTTWTGGVVYYQFDASVDAPDGYPSSGDGAARRAAWRAAAMEWEETVPGLTFVEGPGAGNYILVYSSTGNSSYVGMVGGSQTMNIYNWNYRFIIAHEIGHALGLMHEQTRPDRDTYVTVNYDNIQADKSFNYDIWPGTTSYGTYDYTSVMHYSRCTFAIAGWSCAPDYAMDATAAGAAAAGLTQADANGMMGQRSDLSSTDIEGIKYLYPGSNGLVFSSGLENGRTNAWSSAAGEAVLCAHDVCQSGTALEAGCSQCVTDVCAYDSFCCNNAWDSMCVSYVPTICDISCY